MSRAFLHKRKPRLVCTAATKPACFKALTKRRTTTALVLMLPAIHSEVRLIGSSAVATMDKMCIAMDKRVFFICNNHNYINSV